MRKQSILLAILFAALSSCDLFRKDSGEDALARVGETYLQREDVADLLEKLTGDKDSATIINNYINSWIQQELLLQRAELNLTEEQKDFQKLLEDYRKSLIIYAFEKEWIRQKLDTNVADDAILEYYEENESNFELKENIVKMRFAKVARNAPKLDKLEKMIQSNEAEERAAFKEYCIQYALDYNDNDSIWLTFDKVLQRLPLTMESEEDFLNRNKFVVKADTSNYYLLYIADFKIKSSISPLSFEREKIRNIIVNQRKLALISDMKKDLFETAMEKGNAEIYSP